MLFGMKMTGGGVCASDLKHLSLSLYTYNYNSPFKVSPRFAPEWLKALPDFVYDLSQKHLGTSAIPSITASSSHQSPHKEYRPQHVQPPSVVSTDTQITSLQPKLKTQASQTDQEQQSSTLSEASQQCIQKLQDQVKEQDKDIRAMREEIRTSGDVLKEMTKLLVQQQKQLQTILLQTHESGRVCDSVHQDEGPEMDQAAPAKLTLPEQSVTVPQSDDNSQFNNSISPLCKLADSVLCSPMRSSLRPLELQSVVSLISKFNGDNDQFQGFRCKFNTVVESMELTESDKALILYLSLDDEVIQYLGDITENGCVNYHKLWTELNQEFDTRQHGIYSHISDLFTINSMPKCNTSDQLRQLYKFVRKHYVALKKVGAENEMEGFKVSILAKLCDTLADKVSDIIIRADGQPVVSSILDELREEIGILDLQEMASSLNVSNSNVDDIEKCKMDSLKDEVVELDSDVDVVPRRHDTSILKHPTSQSPVKPSRCVFCQSKSHHSHKCRKYRNPNDYKRVLFQQFRCYNCLCYGHKSYACPQYKQCHLCQDYRKHSPVLCNLYNT